MFALPRATLLHLHRYKRLAEQHRYSYVDGVAGGRGEGEGGAGKRKRRRVKCRVRGGVWGEEIRGGASLEYQPDIAELRCHSYGRSAEGEDEEEAVRRGGRRSS
eukprot:748105-Hanusia_phi.AAC.1